MPQKFRVGQKVFARGKIGTVTAVLTDRLVVEFSDGMAATIRLSEVQR
jgi:preprotein translocase subunit YajC